MIKGIQSFTRGATKAIAFTKAAIASEEMHGKPQMDLPFANNQQPTITLFQTTMEAHNTVFVHVMEDIEHCLPPANHSPHYTSNQP
jgi:hypothetical protein